MRGTIALMTAILLPVLIGVAALVVDFARLFVFKTEVQSAMDACALAASSSLTGVSDPTIFDTARAHGLAMSDPSRVGLAARTDTSVNKVHFHRDNLVQGNIVVEFSTALGGQPWIAATSASYAGITPQTAKYVRCTYSDANNALFFQPVLRVFAPTALSTQSVGATAAASLRPAQSACAFPIAVCRQPGGTSGNNYGRTVGERMTAKNDPGGAYGTGNYGWLDFTPPAGGQSELAALINGSGSCAVTAGTTVGQAGTITALESNWNARFGVYASSMSYATAPPDFTGHGYITSSNNYSDYVTRSAARDPYQNGVGGGNSKLTAGQHGSLGQKRRIATAAIVDCSVWSSGSTNPTVIDFACILLLAPVRNGGSAAQWGPEFATTMDVEYLGLASVAGTPCATSGLGGGSFGPPVPVLVQ
jgi:Flp pilus assembly protein TadG